MTINWNLIPQELKERPQWCIAGPDKAPYLNSSKGLYHASPVKGPWHTFEQACQVANQYRVGIGYIITPDDPFTCIDLDVKDIESRKANGEAYPREQWTSIQQLQGYCDAITTFNSYTEFSNSGKGVHIWVKGKVGDGIKRDGVELYSESRFIICTGHSFSQLQYNIEDNIARPTIVANGSLPLAERQSLLDLTVANINLGRVNKIELVEEEAQRSDREIIELAMNAANADKFNALCQGKWQELGFPSQSEADLALLSMFTFYTSSNEQCRRLFKMSKLGDRLGTPAKPNKNDEYLNRTLKLIRSRQATEAKIETSLVEQARELVEKTQVTQEQVNLPQAQPQALTPTNALPPQVTPNSAQITQRKPEKTFNPITDKEGLTWPPGFVGYLAQEFYKAAHRPVQEVAVVTALGLMAGICGKAFVLSDSGLNMYIILVAQSGVGKEAMHTCTSKVMRQVGDSFGGTMEKFVNFTEFVSAPALTKACAEQPSFVNISGEWGRKLKRLAKDDKDSQIQQLRTQMTNLYQKSGPTSVVGGLGYSNKEQNVASISGVAYSLIGETTPGTLYESLTDGMMEDGFLSRFLIIEYNGKRPPSNQDKNERMCEKMVEALGDLSLHAAYLIDKMVNVSIQIDQNASDLFKQFDLYCDYMINESGEDESKRQMWNRAHLKSLRVAGLLGVGDNHVKPVIQIQHAEWAIDLILRDIGVMMRRMEEGDVGMDDKARRSKMLALLKEYLEKEPAKSYSIPPAMRKEGIIPKRILQIKSARKAAFTNYRHGAARGLNEQLKYLIEEGILIECDNNKIHELYGAQGRCFRIVNLPEI